MQFDDSCRRFLVKYSAISYQFKSSLTSVLDKTVSGEGGEWGMGNGQWGMGMEYFAREPPDVASVVPSLWRGLPTARTSPRASGFDSF